MKEVALVTGGTTGIGKAQVKRWVNEGFDVVFCGRNVERGNEVAADTGARFIQCDVADQESVQTMFKEIRENYPRFDVLLNNAGVGAEKAYRMADIPLESYRKIMSINLDGAWFVMQEAIKLMIERGNGGRIVNMSSVTAITAIASKIGASQYAATKKAIISMTETAAIEYIPEKIRINCVCPAAIMTEMINAFVESHPKEVIPAVIGVMQSSNPMLAGTDKHGVSCDDVTGVVSFLVGPDSKYVNGQAIAIDGGYSIQ